MREGNTMPVSLSAQERQLRVLAQLLLRRFFRAHEAADPEFAVKLADALRREVRTRFHFSSPNEPMLSPHSNFMQACLYRRPLQGEWQRRIGFDERLEPTPVMQAVLRQLDIEAEDLVPIASRREAWFSYNPFVLRDERGTVLLDARPRKWKIWAAMRRIRDFLSILTVGITASCSTPTAPPPYQPHQMLKFNVPVPRLNPDGSFDLIDEERLFMLQE